MVDNESHWYCYCAYFSLLIKFLFPFWRKCNLIKSALPLAQVPWATVHGESRMKMDTKNTIWAKNLPFALS
jgi:hypothetical protein